MPSQISNGVNEASMAAPDKNPEVANLIASLKDCLSGNGSEGSYDRERLKETAERLSIALETPGETVQRVAYYVRQPFILLPFGSC